MLHWGSGGECSPPSVAMHTKRKETDEETRMHALKAQGIKERKTNFNNSKHNDIGAKQDRRDTSRWK